MFEPLPKLTDETGWISHDVITERDALASISRAVDLEREAREVHARVMVEQEDHAEWVESVADQETRLQRQAAGLSKAHAIMLTAMHIEGAVNAWGVLSLGQGFYKQHLERSRLETKIAMLLVVAGQGRIPSDHRALTAIRAVFERRNQLAHRKTRQVMWPLEKNDTVGADPLRDLQACKNACHEFRRLIVSVSEFLLFRIGGFDREEEL